MRNAQSKATDLFLLMLNLSQLTARKKILDIFLAAIEEMWPDTSISYQLSKADDNNIIEIAAANVNYGFIKIDNLARLQPDEQDLLHNAVAILAIILKKNEQDKLLADEKLHLQKLVDEATLAIKDSEEKFRNVFEHSMVGKSITTIEGKLETNKAFRQILGYSDSELAKLKWQDITHGEDIERDQKIIGAIISGEKASAHWEKRYIHKNGSIVWVAISTALQRDHKGKPLYFITSIIDITGRRQAEETIRKMNEELEQRVVQRTAELSAKTAELERINKVFVDRELKMVELKKRIAELEGETISFAGGGGELNSL